MISLISMEFLINLFKRADNPYILMESLASLLPAFGYTTTSNETKVWARKSDATFVITFKETMVYIDLTKKEFNLYKGKDGDVMYTRETVKTTEYTTSVIFSDEQLAELKKAVDYATRDE